MTQGSPSQGSPSQQTGKLPRSIVARFSLGSLTTGGFATLPGLVLVYYLTDSLGVAAIYAGLIVTGAKIWDVLTHPIIGGISDHALARHGSRRGPMLISAIGLPIMFTLTFAVPSFAPPVMSGIWVLLAFMTAASMYGLFQVPYIALPAEMTDSYNERTRMLTWRVVVLMIATLLFGAGGPAIRTMFTNAYTGYLIMAIVAGVVLGVGVLVTALVAPRNTPRSNPQVSRIFSLAHYKEGIAVLRESAPFRALVATYIIQALATGLMLACAQYIATWILHDEDAVTVLFVALIAPAVVVTPLWEMVAKKVGKERGFMIASICFLGTTVIMLAMVWAPGWWIVGAVALTGAAYAGIQSLPMAMLPDVIAHDRAHNLGTSKEEGKVRAGIFGAVWTAGEMAGLAMGSTVLTIVLALTGYVETTAGVTVQQPPQAITGIALAFSLIPAILMVISLFTLSRYSLRPGDFDPQEPRPRTVLTRPSGD